MKTPNWQPVQIAKIDGFRIVLSFQKELINPKTYFINECGWSQDELKSIKDCYWFCAKVTAFKGKIECGSSYLGANTYNTLKDVLGDCPEKDALSGYIEQMIDECIEDAHRNLDE